MAHSSFLWAGYNNARGWRDGGGDAEGDELDVRRAFVSHFEHRDAAVAAAAVAAVGDVKDKQPSTYVSVQRVVNRADTAYIAVCNMHAAVCPQTKLIT